MIFQNFYIVAPVAMLEIALPLAAFKKIDDEGNEDGYYTIPEYLTTISHTVSRYSADNTKFCKGFGFNLAGIDELRGKLGDYGLTLGEDLLILSPGEVQDELAKPEWNKEDEV